MTPEVQYLKSAYDSEAGARYIPISVGTVSRTVPASEDCIIDFAENGDVVGVELLGRSAIALGAE